MVGRLVHRVLLPRDSKGFWHCSYGLIVSSLWLLSAGLLSSRLLSSWLLSPWLIIGRHFRLLLPPITYLLRWRNLFLIWFLHFRIVVRRHILPRPVVIHIHLRLLIRFHTIRRLHNSLCHIPTQPIIVNTRLILIRFVLRHNCRAVLVLYVLARSNVLMRVNVFIRVNVLVWVYLYSRLQVFLVNVWRGNSLLPVIHSVLVHLYISVVCCRFWWLLITCGLVWNYHLLLYLSLSQPIVTAIHVVRIPLLRSCIPCSWPLSLRLLVWRLVLVPPHLFFPFLLLQVRIIILVLVPRTYWRFCLLHESWTWNLVNQVFLVGDRFTTLVALLCSGLALSQMRWIIFHGHVQVAIFAVLGS